MGSDALALAGVIAPKMTGTLTSIAVWIAIVAAAISIALLCAVVWAVQMDYEVVAVTPGGALVPLHQLDKSNEQALRALLAANTSAAQAQGHPEGTGASVAAAATPTRANKASDPNTTTPKRATDE